MKTNLLAVTFAFLLVPSALLAATTSGTPPATTTTNPDARQPEKFKYLSATVDADGDYLVDTFEKAVIDAFAPLFVFHQSETCWPSSVNHHLTNSVEMRIHEPKVKRKFFTDSQIPKPTTWLQVNEIFDRNFNTSSRKFEDIYLALPVDKTLLEPGDDLLDAPVGDLVYGPRPSLKKTSGSTTTSTTTPPTNPTKTRDQVYKAQMRIPMHRGHTLKIAYFDPEGELFQGVLQANIYAGAGYAGSTTTGTTTTGTTGKTAIPDTLLDKPVTLVNGTVTKAVTISISDIHTALAMEQMTQMPDGATPDWSKTKMTLKYTPVGGEEKEVEGSFISGHGSVRGTYLKDRKKEEKEKFEGEAKWEEALYFTSGGLGDPEVDLAAISKVWKTKIPTPTGGAEVYAHVYPLRNFIVVQYWLFFGYTESDREEHAGDWGDRIDVVLYRNDPDTGDAAAPTTTTTPTTSTTTGTATTTAPAMGVIPAYRSSAPFSQKMVAMVIYCGGDKEITYLRTQATPTKLTQKLSLAQKLTPRLPTRTNQTKPKGIPMKWAAGSTAAAGGTTASSTGMRAGTTGTHPVVYVAKGTHRLYSSGGEHRLDSMFKSLLSKEPRVDECAGALPAAPTTTTTTTTTTSTPTTAAASTCVKVLPTTMGKPYVGAAVYTPPLADPAATPAPEATAQPQPQTQPTTTTTSTTPQPATPAAVRLTGALTVVKIVNVGELTASARERLMRHDGAICRELVKAWGHRLPSQETPDEERRRIGKDFLIEKLRADIATGHTAVKADIEAAANAAATSTTGTTPRPRPRKKNLRVQRDDLIRKIRSKIWQKIVAAKKALKASHIEFLETELRVIIDEIIAEEIGFKKVKPLMLLTKTKPMVGGEFIDYPGRWGRPAAADGAAPLTRSNAKYFLKYEMPNDRQMKMLTGWGMNGCTGPAGARPQRYAMGFYRDYDSVAKSMVVYGLEVDL